MNFQRVLVPVAGVALVAAGYYEYGWPGVAVVTGGMMMFLLLHFTRAMTVLKRAANRPIGYVDSAVMLNVKLKKGVPLMHVVAMTRALGELRSPKDEQPELYRWTDSGGSFVDAEFAHGKLRSWGLVRPAEDEPVDNKPTNPTGTA
ncbi:glycerate kinase [Variovorax sp. J22R133]|uniref:glycerate kinase n=1 Tax=Variovorax brevis TaxID=3053503 RepID=UPI002577AC49|nr:glycerate kinase [Variovorax sp. J22R133]MDM0111502.1 glycerate kinase [Variovorax sp. J22R133]